MLVLQGIQLVVFLLNCLEHLVVLSLHVILVFAYHGVLALFVIQYELLELIEKTGELLACEIVLRQQLLDL